MLVPIFTILLMQLARSVSSIKMLGLLQATKIVIEALLLKKEVTCVP